MRFYRAIQLLIVLLSLCAVTACDFHLRGFGYKPQWLDRISLINQGVSHELEQMLRDSLEAYGIETDSNPSLSSYRLFLKREQFQSQIVSVSSSTTPRQYQLSYTLLYLVQSKRAQPVIPLTQAKSSRQLTVNSDRILGSNEEEAQLKQEMIQDIVIQILNRLRSQDRPLPAKRSLHAAA